MCAKTVPTNFNNDHKERQNEVSAEMLERLETEQDFLNQAITGDERRFFEYDPKTKRQSEEWHTSQSPRQKKARINKEKINKKVIIFFSVSRGVVHKEFSRPGVTVNIKLP
jgi:Skp family chaperone for outer membrane proteins